MEKLVSIAESRRCMIDCFKILGGSAKLCRTAAGYRGHISHGLNRLQHYLNDLSTKSADGTAASKILKESPAITWVDGCNGFGAVVGNFCMDLDIKKSKKVGVGWVSAKNSNHYEMSAAFSFSLALNYKQMELYHALPFFTYLLRSCLVENCFSKKLMKFLKIACVVTLTFLALWMPWLTSLDSLISTASRLFPLSRGVFEDKVANIWCSLNVIYKFR
uniref:Alpha-1,3-glucosyltransferase n=1 Tax=Glossina pallidipes TaxID=7398 RepID=A0A1A9ZX93_GLOPL